VESFILAAPRTEHISQQFEHLSYAKRYYDYDVLFAIVVLLCGVYIFELPSVLK